ncbi:MAG: transposase, family [Caballeronia sp.]|nr:transposase, family [Caballeronia sp.]
MSEKPSYQQLQPEERLTIASLHLQGSSMRAMARILGRSPGTISGELMRNSSPIGYASVPAAALCSARRSASRHPAKLCLQSVCWRIVLTLLEWKWSPQQISGTLKRMYPTDSTQHVSHETIYTARCHQPTGQLERRMRGFRDPERTQVFLSNFGPIRQHFALKRHLLRASLYRKQLGERFAAWHRFTELTQGPSAF